MHAAKFAKSAEWAKTFFMQTFHYDCKTLKKVAKGQPTKVTSTKRWRSQRFYVYVKRYLVSNWYPNWGFEENVCFVVIKRYTHKTSGFKTSGFKTSGFKTSETSGLLNVRFTKRQVYKMSGLQNVRFSKRLVAIKPPYIFCTCGWWKSAGSVATMFAGKVMAVFYSLF